MIKTLLHTLLIMAVLSLLLMYGLLGLQQGNSTFQKIRDFIFQKPDKDGGLLTDTEKTIKEFNESYRRIQRLREMTLARSEQTLKELDEIYNQTRSNLKNLLLGMGQLNAAERADLFEKFSALHAERAQFVEDIIRDQQLMINLNVQMEQQLQVVSNWLNEKAREAAAPTDQDVMRMHQYQSLRANLNAFNEQSSLLDSIRVLFMKKSKETIERLAQTNKELENRFRGLLSQVETSTFEQSPELWESYQQLEAEQRELVGNLRATEEFISSNQNQVIAGVTVISQSIQYRSDTQLQRFTDNYAMIEDRRRELLKNMGQRQQVFISKQPAMKQMLQDNRYRMENMRIQARQTADQYEQMEEYRKSAVSMLRSMTSELKDKAEFTSQQTEDVMERSRDHIQNFMVQMDSAQRNINDLIKNSEQSGLTENSSVYQLKALQEKSKSLMENLKQTQDHLRSLRDQAKRDQNSVKEAKNDANKRNAEIVKSAKERTEDQKRMMSQRIQDQMQRIKDAQMDRKR